ncbi:MAG: hypothetical protein ACI88G_002389, partial [Woeseiaceae bacterium]
MTVHYAEPDLQVVDYEAYVLDPEILDRATGEPLVLRGPRPRAPLVPGSYFVCLGAAQTFGRFCQKPFPALLSERLDIPCLNLGRGGAGPSFFSEENDGLMQYLADARFVIVQVMAGRSESNSLFRSKGLGSLTRVSDGTEIGCDDAFAEILAGYDFDTVKRIVEETRHNWIESYQRLLGNIPVPKVLLWFSTRTPEYAEGYNDVYELFGEFPQLVDRAMVDHVRSKCDSYVELVSRRGMPHQLVSRFSGQPVTVRDPWAGEWTEDWYYGSPEMHEDATSALEKPCKSIAAHYRANRSIRRERSPRPFVVLGKARCGSTHLLGLLNSHPGVLGFGELFRDDQMIGWDLQPYDTEQQSPAQVE